MPIEPAIKVIKEKLEKDKELPQRTTMGIGYIISLLEFCLKTTYFLFQDNYYEQIEGAAMGSPICPIVANLFMESFEIRALSLWKRYVDVTFVVQKSAHKNKFLMHINSVDPCIQFTVEKTRPDGSVPLLDILVMPQPLMLTSICSGIATILSLISTLWSGHSVTGPRLCVPTKTISAGIRPPARSGDTIQISCVDPE